MFATKNSQKLNKLCKLALIWDGSKAQAYLQAQITSPSTFPSTEGDPSPSLQAVPSQAPCSAAASPLGRAAWVSTARQAKNPCLGHETGAETALFPMSQVSCTVLYIKLKGNSEFPKANIQNNYS